MQVEILTGPTALRWHVQVARACQQAGFAAFAAPCARGGEKIAGLDLLLAFERLLYRAPDCALQRLTPLAMDPGSAGDAAFVVDLSGAPDTRVENAPVLRPLYDGSPDPAAAVYALLDRRAPKLSVQLRDAQGARIVAQGAIGLRDRRILSFGLNETFARVTSLLVRVLRDLRDGVHPAAIPDAPGLSSPNSPLVFAVGALAEKIVANLLTRNSVSAGHWRVAYRRLQGEGVIETLQWPPTSWSILPDDGQRYYADPFAMVRDGQTHLFVEEYPYATRRGLISHAVISPDGTVGAPRPVLETGCHLSYPFIFEREGQVFMIPETCAERRIALYRAERFPDRWTLDTVLVDGIDASDATLVEHAGRFWVFAALSDGGGSSWDALALFYADNLRGPWRAHPRNPVLIDASAARPGGAIVPFNGHLRRVAQDCSSIYGSGMTICQIDALDPENYRQSVLARLAPPTFLGERAAHTLNRCDGFEVIDFQASPAPREFRRIFARPAVAQAG
jgi:hypothetical protein